MGLELAVFDVLGTVLDERAGFRAAVASTGVPAEPGDALADRWCDRVSELVAHVAAGEAGWRPWEELIGEALWEVATQLPAGPTDGLRAVGRRLPPWPDSPGGIGRVREVLPAVALSNAGVVPLIECSRRAGISWDAVLSAEMVRSAKPDPRVYEFLLDQVRVDPADVVMVAAHPWDLRAAAEYGLRTAYVVRPGEGVPDDLDEFDWVVEDLDELAGELAGELVSPRS